MEDNTGLKTVNFLRGVPSREALAHLIDTAAEGYAEAIRKYGSEVLQYGHFGGFQPLREHIGRIHDVAPERVLVGNGGMEMISLFFKALPPQSTIIIEEMTYDRVVLDAIQYGHKLIGVKMGPDGLDLDAFRALTNRVSAAAFYGIPFHHNPHGINYSVSNRQGVEEICRKKGMFCVWDISYETLRYDGQKNTPIALLEWGPVLINSFTKTVSPGTKCGYLVLPQKIVAHMTQVVSNTRLNPNLPTQAFIADFIASGGFQDYQDYLCDLYKPKMEALNDALNTFFPGRFPAEVNGGFFSIIRFEKINAQNEARFLETARKAGINTAAAWEAVAPNLREAQKAQGLLIRVAFPANGTDQITWGVGKLKELEDAF